MLPPMERLMTDAVSAANPTARRSCGPRADTPERAACMGSVVSVPRAVGRPDESLGSGKPEHLSRLSGCCHGSRELVSDALLPIQIHQLLSRKSRSYRA